MPVFINEFDYLVSQLPCRCAYAGRVRVITFAIHYIRRRRRMKSNVLPETMALSQFLPKRLQAIIKGQ